MKNLWPYCVCVVLMIESLLVHHQCQGVPSYDDEYLGDEQTEEYSYDDDYTEEEPQPMLNPQFTTEAQNFKMEVGQVLRLPCLVDKLGPMVISWKKSAPDGDIQYLATSGHILTQDRRFSVEVEEGRGSSLVISIAQDSDVGEYVCEVSSNPIATLRHQVSIIEPPSVHILRPGPIQEERNDSRGQSWIRHEDGEIRLHSGEELALSCHGTGDPEPLLRWTRERKRMPDGRRHVDGSLIIYKNITRKYAGTYICEGTNGPSSPAQDSVKVNVLHPPEIITEESYVQTQDGVQLELVCIVHASPKADVRWFKDGLYLESNSTFNRHDDDTTEGTLEEPEEDRLSIRHSGRKHILIIRRIEDRDRGHYTCHAISSIGESKGNIQVMGPMADTDSVMDHRVSSSPRLNHRSLIPIFLAFNSLIVATVRPAAF
ncbi:hypothetical protein TCAL_07740 [Tigriopus californicus]|uniref:Ig-like domain-containing protein n=1 Tax=Tigriopus californicus TaxID=6832 RepID=A0A553PMG0_TIGCA|nr:hemicentin-2-like isoform X2 [Tigriopus californicus]TRY78849.1 hypothetical protein TCAL_07740 [Tigriopus californicus]|eukprot:TCALIF_07740-PA protein Name:"Similar to HSPG2 Basement membrane-specific heparan sulfate proteoglycan core protein (Homo sapiens)" AED:0.00 eAED:0.00 QI:214/1/1/1/0.83/0.85/7/740/428